MNIGMVILAAYVVVLLGIAFYAWKRDQKNIKDFATGGGLGIFVLTLTFSATGRPWGKSSIARAWPRRWPHGVHLQKQTNFVCIMRRELVDSFSETTRSGSCADYFPILFCCQSDLYHHDRQPRTGNRPVLLCEQHSHFLCIRPSH